MFDHESRGRAQGLFVECKTQEFAFDSMFGDIDSSQRVGLVKLTSKRNVELAPSHIGLETVDVCVCVWVAEQDSIWLGTDGVAVDLEVLPKPNVSLASGCMVPRRHSTGSGPKGARNIAERMEEDIVDDLDKQLRTTLVLGTSYGSICWT